MAIRFAGFRVEVGSGRGFRSVYINSGVVLFEDMVRLGDRDLDMGEG